MSYYPKQYPVLERTLWVLEPTDYLKRGSFEDTLATDSGPQVAPGKTSGVYISPIVDAGQAVVWQELSWEADMPSGSTICVRTRFGATQEECENARWSACYCSSPAEVVLNGSRESHVKVAAARFLQVRAEMTVGTGGTPTLRGVKLACGLVAPSCVGPMDRAIVADGLPHFYWTRVEGAAGYSLELSETADFSGEVRKYHGLLEPHLVCPEKLAPGVYYWRVRAIDAAIQPTPYSVPREFTVGQRPRVDVHALRHPYLFFNASDVDGIKEALKTQYRSVMDSVLARAEKALESELWDEKDVLLTPGQHSNFHPVAGSVARGQLEPLAFAYIITGEEKYAAKAREIMLHLAGYSRWTGVPFGDPKFCYPVWQAALETAGICKGMATAYDWIYDYLSESDKAAIREGILRLGLLPIIESWTDPRTISYVPRHQLPAGNWWSVCNSGAGVAALALLPEVPDAARWVEMVADAVGAYLCYPGGDVWNIDMKAGMGGQYLIETYPNWGKDGGYIESLGYVDYGLTNALYFIDALKRVTGQDLSHLINEKLIDQAYYCTFTGPDGNAATINFNDSGGKNLTADFYALFARHLHSERAKCLLDMGHSRIESIHAMLADAGSGVKPEEPDLNERNKLFSDIGWCVFRSGWDDDASLMAAKFTHGRGHQDIGQFIINYRGIPFIIDPGVTSYADPVYVQYLKTSRAHNVVLVDDLPQMHADGIILGFAQAPGIGVVEADLTAAYQDVLDSWTRTLIYLEPECFIVVDRLQAPVKRTYSWLIHPNGRLAAQPGLGATFYQDQYEMQMRMLSPAQWRITSEQGYIGTDAAEYLSFSPETPCAKTAFIAVFTGSDRGRSVGVEKQDMQNGTAVRIITPTVSHTVLLQESDSPASIWSLQTRARIAAISRARTDGGRSCRWLIIGSGEFTDNGVQIAPAVESEQYRAGSFE